MLASYPQGVTMSEVGHPPTKLMVVCLKQLNDNDNMVTQISHFASRFAPCRRRARLKKDSYPDSSISPAGCDDVQSRVDVNRVTGAEVPVVVTHHLILFQVPAFHLQYTILISTQKYSQLILLLSSKYQRSTRSS